MQVNDGRSALDALDAMEGVVDVVLLDYRSPDSDDFTLLGEIRRAAPDAAVALMTAYGIPDVMDGAVALGVSRVMTKPFDMNDLRA